jgi:O-antigen/teichoic acid export membrane protein
MGLDVVVAAGQTASLLLLRMSPALSFYVYTGVMIVGRIFLNLYVARTVDRLYPYIKEKNVAPIKPDTQKKLYQNIRALSVAKISRMTLDTADFITISATLSNGLSLIGKYTNYTIIVSQITSVFTVISQAVTASLGNYLATEDDTQQKAIFNSMNLLFTWLYGFCFICLWVLLDPFIGGIWVSEEWLLSNIAVFLISLNFLLNGIGFTPMKFIQSAGLYWQARYRYVISAVLNVPLTILFGVGFHWGIEGIIFATTLAIVGMTVLDPYVVFKYLFHEKSLPFYCRYLINLVVIILTGALTLGICDRFLPDYTMFNFILRILVCIIVPNSIWLALLFRTTLFKETVSLLMRYAKATASRNR